MSTAPQPPPSSPAAGPEPEASRLLVTIAITVGAIMGALDASIVNVALPYMRANLGVTITEVTWISTGYIIALVIIMPLTAWLGMTFGRKRVYMVSLAVFTISSLFCGAARSLASLLLFRVIQGLGAGALQPTQQAILRETYPAHQQGLAMGIYGFAVMIGPAVGPTLGGWITDNYNWPWIFYINVPIGIVALWLVQQYLHDPPHARAQGQAAGLDVMGIATLAVGLGCLQTVLEEGQRLEWFSSGFVTTLTIIAVLCLVFFTYWELWRAPKPAVDLRVLGNLPFAAGTVIGGILGLSLFSSMFLLPLFMQELLGYPAMKSGLVMLPRALVMLVLLPVMGLVYNRAGPRKLVGVGLVIAGLAALAMSRFTLDTGVMQLFWPQVFQGVGFSCIFVALSTAALVAIPKPRMTSATGLYNLIRQLGGSVGTAIFASMLTSQQQAAHARLMEHLNPYSPAFSLRLQQVQSALVSRGLDQWHAQSGALGLFQGMVSRHAAMLAFNNTFFIAGVLVFLCLPLVLLLKRPRTDLGPPTTR
jgi:MFS transporter, DHA2 family, multidrug resistance protein